MYGGSRNEAAYAGTSNVGKEPHRFVLVWAFFMSGLFDLCERLGTSRRAASRLDDCSLAS